MMFTRALTRSSSRFSSPLLHSRLGVRSFSTPKVTVALIKQLRGLTDSPMKDCKNALAQAIEEGLTDEQEILDFATDEMRRQGVNTANKKAGRVAMQGLIATHVVSNGTEQTAAVVEVNSETDFVAKNEKFHELVTLVTRAVSTGPNGALSGEEVKALVDPVTQTSVETAVTDLVSSIRENIQVRRSHKISTNSGDSILKGYIHSSVVSGEVSMGKIGSLVQVDVEPTEGWNVEGVEALGHKLAMHAAAASPKYLDEKSVPVEDLEREQSIYIDQAKAEGKPEKVIQGIVKGRTKKFYEQHAFLNQPFIFEEEGAKSQSVAQVLVKGAKDHGSEKLSLTDFVRFEVGEGQEAAENDFAAEVASMSKGN